MKMPNIVFAVVLIGGGQIRVASAHFECFMPPSPLFAPSFVSYGWSNNATKTMARSALTRED